MPLALVVVEGATGNAQGPAEEVHEFGASNTPVSATTTAKDDIKPACQPLLCRRGGGREGSCRIVVNDHGGPNVDGPRNGEDHVGEAWVFEESRLNGGVEAAMAA